MNTAPAAASIPVRVNMKLLLLWCVVLFFVVIAVWMARGLYDKIYLYDSRFLVVNAAEEEFDVVLEFPSGHREKFQIKPDESYDCHVADTGEGSILISLNGMQRDSVGYVTSLNPPTVITIKEDESIVSQISRD